jgi:hypothetical protein
MDAVSVRDFLRACGFDGTGGLRILDPGQPISLRSFLKHQILETDFVNPQFDTSDPNWALAVADNIPGTSSHTWLSAATPVWEWTPVLDKRDEFDSKLVACAGTAVGTHVSERDVPFQHPFGAGAPGFDLNFNIAPDKRFERLLTPTNRKDRGDQETVDSVKAARDLGIPVNGVLHVEIDEGLAPSAMRPIDGDRVAVFGRWIIDCGHDSFSAEIHPPLVLASARSESENQTHSTVLGRAYLVSQEFGDGALRQHLINEIIRVAPKVPGIPVPFGTNVEARPRIHTTPFAGIQLMKYFVRPARRRQSADERLMVRFHFTVRSGVTVQVFHSNDTAGVLISMNDVAYTAAPLPPRQDVNVTIDDLDRLQPGLGPTIRNVLVGAAVGGGLILGDPASLAVLAGVLAQGVRTDVYSPPQPPNVPDSAIISVPIDQLPSADQHFTVEDTQPFPIYGFLDVSWSS